MNVKRMIYKDKTFKKNFQYPAGILFPEHMMPAH